MKCHFLLELLHVLCTPGSTLEQALEAVGAIQSALGAEHEKHLRDLLDNNVTFSSFSLDGCCVVLSLLLLCKTPLFGKLQCLP